MTDKDALGACPFCGGRAVMRRDSDPGYPCYVTFDHESECVMYAVPTDLFRSFSNEAEAIAAWNRRAPAQPFDAALLREAAELAIADASYHLSKYRPHVLKALKAALAALPPVKQSVGHLSDCVVHNEPAMPNGPCDCGFGRQRGGAGE